jgi:hypothetical protein
VRKGSKSKRPIPMVDPAIEPRIGGLPRGVPRLALTRLEAAISLGISVDSFERYVQPHLKLIRRGKLRLVPIAELQRWVDESATRWDEGRING